MASTEEKKKDEVKEEQGQEVEGRTIVYLRFPFKRDGFVNPQQISWNEVKERELWEYLTKHDQLTNYQSIDWNILSNRFEAPVVFLKQQVFWLYQHKLLQLQQDQIHKQKQKQKQEQQQQQQQRQGTSRVNQVDEVHSGNLDFDPANVDIENYDYTKLFKQKYHNSVLRSLGEISSNRGARMASGASDGANANHYGGSAGESAATTSANLHHEEAPTTHTTTPVMRPRAKSPSSHQSSGLDSSLSESRDAEFSGNITDQLNNVTAHLHSSRILSARVPSFDDDDDSENSGNEDEDGYQRRRSSMGAIAEQSEERPAVSDSHGNKNYGDNDAIKNDKSPGVKTGDEEVRSPLLEQIKLLASKYRQ